jgi:DNA-binding MarR family transcriptional regulator
MDLLGLTGPLGFYLMEINKATSIKMNQLVDLTPYHKSHATRMILKLSEMDYVEKLVDPMDQRGFILLITEKGHKMAIEVKKAHEDWEKLVDGALSKDEYEVMTELMKKTYTYLKEHFEEDLK